MHCLVATKVLGHVNMHCSIQSGYDLFYFNRSDHATKYLILFSNKQSFSWQYHMLEQTLDGLYFGLAIHKDQTDLYLLHLVFNREFMQQATCLGVAIWHLISGLWK